MPRFSIIDTLRTHRTEPGTSNRAACLQTMLFSFMFTRAERKRGSDNFTVRKVARWERERTIETNQVRLNETVEERFTCAFSRVHAFTPAYIRIYIYMYTYASIVGVQRRSKKEDERKGHRHLASNLAGEETKWPTEEGTRRVGVRTEARSDFHSYSR